MPDIYNGGSFEEIVLYILGGILLAICVGCIYAFIRAIFLFIFSNGENEKITAARKCIRYMILGMVFTVILIFVSPTLLKYMRVPGAESYTPGSIFNSMGKIIGHLTSLGDIIKESQKDSTYRGDFYYNGNPSTYNNPL